MPASAIEFGGAFNRAGFKQQPAHRPDSAKQVARPMSAAPARTAYQPPTATRPSAARPSTAHDCGGRRSSRNLYQRLPVVRDSRIQHSVKQLPPRFRDSRPGSAHAPDTTIQGLPRTAARTKRPKRGGRKKRKAGGSIGAKLPVLANQTHPEPLQADSDHKRREGSFAELEHSPILYPVDAPVEAPVVPPPDETFKDGISVNEVTPIDPAKKEAVPVPQKQPTEERLYTDKGDRIRRASSPDVEPPQQSLMQLCQKLHDDNSMLRSKFAGMITLVHKSNERGAKFDLERRALEKRVEELKKELEGAKPGTQTRTPEPQSTSTAQRPVESASKTPVSQAKEAERTSAEDTQIWKGVRKFSTEYFALTMFKHKQLPVVRFVARQYTSDADINEATQTLYLVLPENKNTETVAWCTDAVQFDEKSLELKVSDGMRLVSSYATYNEDKHVEETIEIKKLSKPSPQSPSQTMWKGAHKFGKQYTLLTMSPLPPPDHHKILLTVFNVQSSSGTMHSTIEIELPLLHRWSFAYMDVESEDGSPHAFPEAVAAWCLERVEIGSSGELELINKSTPLIVEEEEGSTITSAPKPKAARGFKMLEVKKKDGDAAEDDADDPEAEHVPDVHIAGVSFPLMHCEIYTLWRAGKRLGGLYYLLAMEFSSQLNAGTVIVSKTRAGESEPTVIHLYPPKELVSTCYESRRLDKMRDWGLGQLKAKPGWV